MHVCLQRPTGKDLGDYTEPLVQWREISGHSSSQWNIPLRDWVLEKTCAAP